MVIIKEDNVQALQSPLGRITKIYKGDDGAVRVVDVRTSSGIWKRPIHRLAPLPVEHEEENNDTASGNNAEETIHSTTAADPVTTTPSNHKTPGTSGNVENC